MRTFTPSALTLFAAFFICIAAPVQSQPLKSRAQKNIVWLSPGTEHYEGNYSVSYLRFEGAVFDKSFVPHYREKIALNASAEKVNAEIKDALFSPVEEISLLEKFKDQVSNSIQVQAQVAYETTHAYAIVTFLPFRKNPLTGAYEKLVSFNITLNEITGGARGTPPASFTNASVLGSGSWYKIAVARDGVYKIDYDFLNDLGIDIDNVNPAYIRLYGNGGGMLPFANSAPRIDDLTENAIYVSGEGDGQFNAGDYILFYGQGQVRWMYDSAGNVFHHLDNYYSDSTFYFINTDLGQGERITMQPSTTLPATHFTTTFNDFVLHETDLTNCVKSGKEWYGESFDPVNASRNFLFSFPNISTSSPVCLRSDVNARAVNPPYPPSGFNVFANGQPVLTQTVPTVGNYYFAACANEVSGDTCFNVSSDDVNISLFFNASYSGATGQLNYLELNAKRNLTLWGNQMTFRSVDNIGTGNITDYTLGSVNSTSKIWDVTNPANVHEQAVTPSGSSYIFRLPTDSLREFIAFNGSSYLVPKAIGKIDNQNLHAIASAEMVIVTHPFFIQQANRLADHHRNFDSLTVEVVTTLQVYNEFSSGAQDVSAIRDFMRMLFERNQTAGALPRYLLLFGDGSYDNKHRLSGNTNYVVTYQSDNSLDPTSTYISDDFFGFLNPNEGYWPENSTALLDIGIGRFPVKTTAEADAVVNKTINYALSGTNGNTSNNAANTGFGEWRNIVTFVADDEDSNTHFTQSQQLATKVDTGYPEYNIEKIYLDAYTQTSTVGGERYEGAEEAFKNRVQRGTLLISYTGHGGEVGLAHERVLSVETINNWTNFNRLAAFLTATCEFARVDDPARNSAGEFVILNPNGGGVVLFTTTRLAFSGSNFQLSRKFFDCVFEPINGSMPRNGDVNRITKNGYLDSNVRNFIMLGDPALRLAYPRWNVVTTVINNHAANLPADTVKGLNKVSVSGEIHDDNGQLMSNFNGTLIASVYDKYATLSTLANDFPGSTVQQFKVRKNILFKGKATVANGKFDYTFVLPKDIAPLFDKGKISYYAHNGVTDANGYFDNLIIGGGYDTSVINDNAGPEIKLFMNDDKFVSGGVTDANPIVYANVADSSGINSSGNGIGHDITVMLDNDPDKLYTANDYFECDLNSYQKGKVLFPLTELSDGKHTAELKVWDALNNSSKSTIDFYVNSSKEVVLQHVYNYPNPFTTKTSFMFEHNRACVPMNVQVQILTVTGKLIKTISRNVTCEGFRVNNIEWDGRDDYGDKIGRGVYIYRLRVKTSDGYTADKMEKLVKL